MKTALIDYGASNLHSVYKALVRAGFDADICARPADAAKADVLVLPGQGHFGQVMTAFLDAGFEDVVRQHIAQEKPFLGICVGLQILMESSEEAPDVPGLGVINGQVKRFQGDMSVPQMGWNQIQRYGESALLDGVSDNAFVYFANSYYVDFSDSDASGATTTYGNTTFKSALSKGPLNATQFHPEKSQVIGLKILENFRHVAEQYAA